MNSNKRPRALRCTYIYLGFASSCANHVQLLYGQRLPGQLQADVVRVVGLLVVQQSNSGFRLLGLRRALTFRRLFTR